MTANFVGLLAIALLGLGAPVEADAAPAFDKAIQPSVRCIYRVLTSSNRVRRVSLYSVDGFRFAIEYAFLNKENQLVVFEIAFIGSVAPFRRADWIPREVPVAAADEARELETILDLDAKCGLRYAFDNVLPGPSARADWEKIEWPWDHHPSK